MEYWECSVDWTTLVPFVPKQETIYVCRKSDPFVIVYFITILQTLCFQCMQRLYHILSKSIWGEAQVLQFLELQNIYLWTNNQMKDAIVLITGESGAGKGVIAKSVTLIWAAEVRSRWYQWNCGAIPENLLELNCPDMSQVLSQVQASARWDLKC